MTASKRSPKDPQDVRDYWIDFSSLLGTATIASATIAVPSGQTTPVSPFQLLALEESDHTDHMVRARFSGGSPGSGTASAKYAIQYHVTSSTGEEFDLTKTLEVKERVA